MYDYVCFIAPTDYCVELSLVDETFSFCEICSHFILKCLYGNVGELQKDEEKKAKQILRVFSI